MTKKTNSRTFCENMLSKPNSQNTEVLFELMANYKEGLTALQITKSCDVPNVANILKRLKQKGLLLDVKKESGLNKYGKKTKYGRFYLLNFKNAVEVYETMIEKK